MFYEEIKAKQDLSYISICSLSILYNSKFILMATALGTNAAYVMRVHCIFYRAATIVLRDDNCHFLRVDKDDFNRILRASLFVF